MQRAAGLAVLLWIAGAEQSWGWDGLDPFSRPSATTAYYGSGDIDLDGMVSASDLEQLRAALRGERSPHARMDADGDGAVTAQDEALLQAGLGGATRPSDWDRLVGPEARRTWLKRMVAVDPGNLHPYSTLWQQCVGFSTQLYLRFSGGDADLFATEFSASGAEFDLPMYCVSIVGPTLAHAINAVLVGDDPTRFTDWMFIEPQNDSEIPHASRWFPTGATVTLYVPKHLQWVGHEKDERVVFQINPSGPELVRVDSRLIRQRPRPEPAGPPPPRAFTGATPLLLARDRGTLITEARSTDGWGRPCLVAMANPFSPDARPKELATNAYLLRPLASVPLGEGQDYLLWRSDEGARRFLNGAILSRDLDRMGRPERIATDRSVLAARVEQTRDGTLHVVWLEVKTTADHPHPSGLYWTQRRGTAWSTPQRIVEVDRDLDPWQFDHVPDARRHFFDLCRSANDQLVLGWVRRTGTFAKPQVQERRYQQGWTDSRVIADLDGPTAGLDLFGDTAGGVHLAYWSGLSQLNGNQGRGTIRYRRGEGENWSAEETVGQDAEGFGPRLVERPDGRMGMVWDQRADGRSRVAWSERTSAGWLPLRLLPAPRAHSSRNPQVARLEGGLLAVAWEEWGPGGTALGMLYLLASGSEPAQPTTRVSTAADGPRRMGWSAIPGQRYTVETNPQWALTGWLAAGPSEVAVDYRGTYEVPSAALGGVGFLRVRGEPASEGSDSSGIATRP